MDRDRGREHRDHRENRDRDRARDRPRDRDRDLGRKPRQRAYMDYYEAEPMGAPRCSCSLFLLWHETENMWMSQLFSHFLRRSNSCL